MQDNQRQHSGIDTAKRIVSAARIAKAAAAGGVHGAAVAAAKEAAPFLAKLAIWVLAALIALPMLIFAYLPNIFFGFSSSGTAPVARMTGQTMTLGGLYMELEDFENTQIDAIVTSLIQQYEEEGIEIDGVEIDSDFDEEDLRWFIAISSVAYQQDLEVMTTEAVLLLATSRLRYEPTLNIFEFGGLLKRTLVIKIDHLDPEAFMDQLSFEEDARTWAGALHEVLTESDALEEYAEYYCLGNNLSRALTSELAMLATPETIPLFLRKYQQKQIKQYRRREPIYKGMGDIICCLDESSSTEGEAAAWGKAVAMTLLEIAAESRRSFALIHFAGSNSCQVDIFRPGEYTLEDKLTAAEIFLGGGTNFERPIREAIHLMEPKGFEKADVVFITDGECELPDGCQQELQVSQTAYHFTVTGILLDEGQSGMDFSLKPFCQKIYRISELTDNAVVQSVINLRV